jgi:hypothetical protein
MAFSLLSLMDQFTTVHSKDQVGQIINFPFVVGDVKYGNPCPFDGLKEQLVDFIVGLLIQGAERFVQAQVFRANGKGSAQGNPLAFSATQPIRHTIQQVRYAESLGQFLDPLGNKRRLRFAKDKGKSQLTGHA